MTTHHAAKPRRAKGESKPRLAEEPRGPEPEWVSRARDLRRRRWSYQRIADELGLTLRRVYVALNRERVKATDRRYATAHRTELSQRTLAARRAVAPDCTLCGQRLSRKPRVLPAVCRDCRLRAGGRRQAIIAGLWIAGYTGRQIAEALGETDQGRSVGATVTNMRNEGWALPYRREGR